jgi:mono/diheme cytochrome c family protein
MRRLLRWMRYVAGALTLLVVAAVIFVYARSEWILNRRWHIPATEITVPTDSASVALGLRLATLRGCTGCHGPRLEGSIAGDIPHVARIVAPNLARLARSYSTVDLERSIRHGVKPDGRSVVLMPSVMFFNLSDADLGAIIAYLRSVTPATDTLPSTEIYLPGRAGLVLGKYQTMAGQIDHAAARIPTPRPGDSVALGNYLVHTSCTECHRADLRGGPMGNEQAPNLAIVAGYSRTDFTHLMRTGEPMGQRTLQMMAKVAKKRFSHFTDDEIGGVYAYLRSIGNNTDGSPPPKQSP